MTASSRIRYRCALLAALVSVSPLARGAETSPVFDRYGVIATTPIDTPPPEAASLVESLPPPPARVALASPPLEAAAVPMLAPPSPAPAEVVPAAPEPVAAAEEPTPAEVFERSVAEAPEAIEPPIESVEVAWYRPTRWFGPTPWESGFEFGLNGASGTSESLSFRTGGFLKRESDDYKFDSSLFYNKTSAEGLEVQSNALLDVRYDFKFDDSPWTLFVLSQTFYDEFQAFDINVNANSGVGYQWIDEEWAKLTTSVGSGASREFGDAVADEWVPEASFGLNFEQRIGESHRFYAKADYFPQWEDFNKYRVVADIGLEIDLDTPTNTSLKFSATDRFDSDPGGVEPHNFNYSALLLWRL